MPARTQEIPVFISIVALPLVMDDGDRVSLVCQKVSQQSFPLQIELPHVWGDRPAVQRMPQVDDEAGQDGQDCRCPDPG